MPYTIRKSTIGGKKLYLIVRKTDGKVVGRSTTAAKAGASIGFRMRGERQ
jgi:hypothetical protein